MPRFISERQTAEARVGGMPDPVEGITLAVVERGLVGRQQDVRRRMVSERQNALSGLVLQWPHPWHYEFKHRQSGESGREVVPLPSMREDGQTTDWVYRVWFGSRWVPVHQEGDTVVEAQVREYIDDHEGFRVGGSDRERPQLAICTRARDLLSGGESAVEELFRFRDMVSPGWGGGDIEYRGNSMPLAVDSPEWADLDTMLLALHDHFGEPARSAEYSARDFLSFLGSAAVRGTLPESGA
jgi:hypothetical protein